MNSVDSAKCRPTHTLCKRQWVHVSERGHKKRNALPTAKPKHDVRRIPSLDVQVPVGV